MPKENYYFYLTMLSRLPRLENWQIMKNHVIAWAWKEAVAVSFKYYPRMWMEELKNIMTNHSKDNRCPSQDLSS